MCVPHGENLPSQRDAFLPKLSLELSYTWIFNEYPSFVEEDGRRFISQETGHLYVAKVEPSDVGNYTCVVTNVVTAARVLGSPTPLMLRADGRKLRVERRRIRAEAHGGRGKRVSENHRFICFPTRSLFERRDHKDFMDPSPHAGPGSECAERKEGPVVPKE